jgi:hypothetical protein
MIIRTIKDLEIVKEQLSEQLLNNTVFSKSIEYDIHKMLADCDMLDATISDDGKTVIINSEGKITRDSVSKNELSGLKYTLEQDGKLSKNTTYGVLYDADQYYRDRTDRPFFHASAVLGTFYQHRVFDQDGIEISYSDYSKPAYPLTGVNYYDTKEFKTQLFGMHMPQEWNLDGPVNPRFASGGTVSGTLRNPDYPGIATLYRYDLEGLQAFPINRKSYLAEIHGEYPERLRVDEWGKFATFEDGDWKVYDPYGVYEGKTIKEIISEKVRQFGEVLDSSNTRMYNNPQYEILKEMADRSVEREEEQSGIRR